MHCFNFNFVTVKPAHKMLMMMMMNYDDFRASTIGSGNFNPC